MLKSFYWHGIFSTEKVAAEEKNGDGETQREVEEMRHQNTTGRHPTLAHFTL